MKKSFLNKLFVALSALVSFSSLSFADVSVNDQGIMSGSLNMTPFYSAVGVVIGALAVIVAVKAGIRLLKGV